MMAGPIKLFRRLTAPSGDNPELLRAQYRALAGQLPMMYLILLVNTWVLAVTHLDTAPGWLAVGIPALLTLVCLPRAHLWWRTRHVLPEVPQILHTLTRTNRLSPLFAAGFAGWSLALYPYGNSYAQGHVAFFMAITVIVCIFCLMHMRTAALITTAVVNTAFVLFFASTHNPVFIATAINIVLVSGAMLVVLQIHYRDFTALVNMQARTERLSNENMRLANEDSLTGLPNRRQFFGTLDACLLRARGQEQRLAVGILDLDGFKPVNDVYGHSVGDRLLVQVGQRLLRLADEHTHIARLGGDEFALIITDGRPDDALRRTGEAVCLALQEAFMLVEVPIRIGASLGIATYPDMAKGAAEVYEFADYALYQSKRHSKGGMCLFSTEQHAQLHRDAMTEQALRKADLYAEFHVLFQPILNCVTGQTVAFEALARWTSPDLGPVSPARFIPVAEHIGMITQLTLPLLTKALQAARQWPGQVRLAFNLSAHDCASSASVQSIIEVIDGSGFDPSRLDLEITETAIMHDIVQVQRAIARFRDLGCGISLDDFGTGYSSLSQLHALALTKLKIDRSFVTDIHCKPASYKIVKSLVALSQDMALDCVVEGVETAAEMEALRSLGCTWVQGFLFSRPVAFEQTLVWLEGNEALRSRQP
ncbi:EAL domain-containing protein [Pseudomonas sp. HR96]|uniref:putative bifunctional diguanylate cyclase/phosphodiesterase n=1 Tax=Pseudomonas sp. HR96 TaxID=1027966 RepID=UPI002A766393|nr:EAL domain-containing protein [Pseudomonas sp. HR96]WPO98323.1 EAL domain-containing protein [Pseudomonas sp. HR96]